MNLFSTKSSIKSKLSLFLSLVFALLLASTLVLSPTLKTSAIGWDDFFGSLFRPTTNNYIYTAQPYTNICNNYNTVKLSKLVNNETQIIGNNGYLDYWNTGATQSLTTYTISGKVYNPSAKTVYFTLYQTDGYIGNVVRSVTQTFSNVDPNSINRSYYDCNSFVNMTGDNYSISFDNQGLNNGYYTYKMSFDSTFTDIAQEIKFNTNNSTKNTIYVDSPYISYAENPYNKDYSYVKYTNQTNGGTYTYTGDKVLQGYLVEMQKNNPNGIMFLDYKCNNTSDLSLLTIGRGQNICGEYTTDSKMTYIMTKYAQKLGYQLGDEDFMTQIRDNQGIIWQDQSGFWMINFNRLQEAINN